MSRHFVPLGKIAEVIGGYAFKSSMMSSEPKEFQIIKMSNLYQGSLDLSRNPSFWEKIDTKTEPYLLQTDDILMTLTGTVGKRDYGYTVQLRDEEKLLLNQRVCRIRPIHKKVDGFYLFQYLRTQEFLNKFFDCSIGGTGNQSNVSISDLRKLDIYLPPLPEQKAIAALLSTWDKAIEKTERLIQAKEKRFKWLLRELISEPRKTQKDAKWIKVKIGSFLTESRNPDRENDPKKRLSVRLHLKGVEVRDYRGTESDGATVYFVRKAGQFIYGKQNVFRGSVGIVPLELDGYSSTQDIPAFDVASNVDKNWLLFLFSYPNFYKRLELYASGSGSKRLHPKELFKMKVALPSFEEQQEISETLSSAQHEVDLLKQLADKYKTQKRGLMQKMLAGEWRVRGFATSEEV